MNLGKMGYVCEMSLLSETSKDTNFNSKLLEV